MKKLYVPVMDNEDYQVAVPVGEYDQNYGSSYVQLGERARFMHKSQGMGVHYDEGPTYNYRAPAVFLDADSFSRRAQHAAYGAAYSGKSNIEAVSAR